MRLLLAAGMLALFTVTFQFWFITKHYGEDYIRHEQMLRSGAVANHTARAPYRYRLLSDTIFYDLATYFKAPEGVAYIFRLLQNFAIFLLAGVFFKTLNLSPHVIKVGWLLIAYAMCFALHQSDLGFSTYSEILIGLAAAIAALRKQAALFIIIVALAALNRESSILLAALWLIHTIPLKNGTHLLREKERWIPAFAGMTLFLITYAVIYFTLGQADYSGSRYGSIHPGLLLLWLNLINPRVWLGLISMYFPILILTWHFRGQKMPDFVRIWGAGLVLPWYSAMLLFGSADETRLFLLPLILWAVPATLQRLRKP